MNVRVTDVEIKMKISVQEPWGPWRIHRQAGNTREEMQLNYNKIILTWLLVFPCAQGVVSG